MECKELPGRLQAMGLHDNLNRMVAVMASNNSLLIDGCIHVCLTQKALQETADLLMKRKGVKCGCVQIPLGNAIDNVFYMSASTLTIYGLLPGGMTLTKDELLPLRDVTESYVYMNEAGNDRMSVEEAYDKLKDKCLYIQGSIGVNENITFSVLNRTDDKGVKYNSIMSYLTYEHAIKKNLNNYPINCYKFSELRRFYGNVIVEPDEQYWFEVRK